MKIRVIFKMSKSEGYDENNKFTYLGYEGVEVNDIVVVNTRYGYAIAKVVEVDVTDDRFDENNLATIKEVIETAKEQKEKQNRKDELNTLVKKIKRNQIETALLSIIKGEAEQKLVKNMTDEEIRTFYNAIMK